MKIRLAVVSVLGPLLAWPAAAQAPGDVGPTVRVASDRQSITWGAVSGADSYNVYRGLSPALADQTCLVVHTTSLAAADSAAPASGELFYYLVSAVNSSGEGTLGNRSDGTPRPNTAPCQDMDADLVPDNRDNCPGVANPSQADQNSDGLGDACDGKTYDFEADALGARPAAMTQTGGVEPSFLVRAYSGDKGVAYDSGNAGVQDVFVRFGADEPFEPTNIYIDFDGAAETSSLELWSDGAYGANAGEGVIFQIGSGGQVKMYQRTAQNLPVQDGPSTPLPGGRARLRLLPGAGTDAALHVDSFDGASFVEDFYVFTIEDRHRLAGLDVSTANYIGGRRGLKRITVEHIGSTAPLRIRKHYSWSSDYKVFQRSSSGSADLPLRFFYSSAEPARLEARVVESDTSAVLPGHDYSDHALDLPPGMSQPGTFAVTGVPTGGDYEVEARLVRVSDSAILGADVLSHVAVGDVFISGGQSNMSGYSGTLANAETPMEQAHLFGNDYNWKQASEPMDSGVDQVDAVSAESPQHSLMLRFAKDTFLATGVPIGVIVGPLGGTNLYSQWQRDASDHDNRATLYGSLLYRGLVQNYAAPIKGFLWYQGESDVGRTTSQYLNDLKRLLSEYREDLSNPDLYLLNAQLATDQTSDLASWLAIKEAQREQETQDSRTALITTMDQPRADTVHLTVAGYKAVGARFAVAARELIYGQPIDAGARQTSVRFQDFHRKSVDIVYDAPVSGGETAPFLAYDDGAPVSVTSVLTSGNTVTLQLASRIRGNGTLSYGFSRNPATNWVVNASGVPVPNFHQVPITGP